MCGIFATTSSAKEIAKSALRKMNHRGPDQNNIWDLGFATIGVVRLAITDPVHGNQPLVSVSGKSAVVFNGAIYNANELRKYFNFKTKTGNDGEVIHQLYERYGLEFASYLDGMFSIVIADFQKKVLILSVDSIGIKPLYISNSKKGCFIASILQAFPKNIALKANRLPPGTVWSTGGDAKRYSCRIAKKGVSFGNLLIESVERQIPKEVEWGCLLSGGVDSSTIVAIAARKKRCVKTFTTGLIESEDRKVALEVAQRLGTEHHEKIISIEELPELLEAVVLATASPDVYIAMSGVGTLAAARCAAQANVKVLLSGEGADELFAGYDEYIEEARYALNARLVHDQIDLGATECLRLDRCTMDQSIEARVPFLSSSIVRCARSLSPDLKLQFTNSDIVRKPLLRSFANKLLPYSIAYRPKNPFFRGAGLNKGLHNLAAQRFNEKQVSELQKEYPLFSIVDPLSAWTFSIWNKHYGRIAKSQHELTERGLFRRRFSLYQPNCEEPCVYLASSYSK